MMAPALRSVPSVKAPGTAAAMIAVATSQVGYREGSNNDTAYGEWYGMNRVAWCAIFQSWAAAKSGCAGIIPRHAYTPSGASWFKVRGQWGTRPRVGAIAYYYNASMGRIAHVELVVKVYDDGSWLACGGNTNNTGSRSGNGVYLLRRTTTRGGGFGYPSYKPTPTAPKPPAPGQSVPVVDLSDALAELEKTGHYPQVVWNALNAEGFTSTKAGYRRFQQSLGYTGADADGIAGKESLSKLGDRRGFTVRA